MVKGSRVGIYIYIYTRCTAAVHTTNVLIEGKVGARPGPVPQTRRCSRERENVISVRTLCLATKLTFSSPSIVGLCMWGLLLHYRAYYPFRKYVHTAMANGQI